MQPDREGMQGVGPYGWTSAKADHVSACPIPEGQECPTCNRRVPKKAKPSSPKTKVVSIRVPVDDAETFEEILIAAAKHAGLYEKGHWKFWTVHHGLVLLLQEPAGE